MGLLSFAVCLRRLGVGVTYLGGDVPVADWEAAVKTLQPKAAVVGVPLCASAEFAQEVVDMLAGCTPPVDAWVGGAMADEVTGAKQLPTAVAVAADEVMGSLRVAAG